MIDLSVFLLLLLSSQSRCSWNLSFPRGCRSRKSRPCDDALQRKAIFGSGSISHSSTLPAEARNRKQFLQWVCRHGDKHAFPHTHTCVSKWVYLQMFRVYASAASGALLGPRFSRSGASIKESHWKWSHGQKRCSTKLYAFWLLKFNVTIKT